jgi:hypothetical protein
MSLNRITDEFKSYGLVAKNSEGMWYFIGVESESDFDKNVRLVHSQKLIPWLKFFKDNMLLLEHINKKELDSLKKPVIEHLQKGYPVIYSKFVEFENLSKEESIKSYSNFNAAFKGAKILTPDKFWVMDFVETGEKGFLSKYFPRKDLMRINVPYAFAFENKAKAFKALEKAGIRKESVRIMTQDDNTCQICGPLFIQASPEKIQALNQLNDELKRAISILIDQVEFGIQPLKGSCSLCST